MASCANPKQTSQHKFKCANDPKFKERWEHAVIKDDCPIVDVHTHLFNSRYMPLKHVVKARMWAAGASKPLTLIANGLGLTDAAAVLLATRTPADKYEAAARQKLVDAYLARHGGSALNDVDLFHAMAHSQVSNPKLDLPFRDRLRGSPEDIGPLEYLAYETFGEGFLVDYIAKWFVHDPADGVSANGVASFAVGMMSEEGESLKRMERLFPQVDLFVYQSMDLVPSFYAGHTHAYSYSRDDNHDDSTHKPAASLPRIRELCKESDGRLIHFVAWNPFRTLNREGGAVPSLQLVKQAVQNGASGVKFYPPLGYRPSCNDFTGYKKPFFLSEARKQWNNRYLGNHPHGRETDVLKQRAQEMDRVNEELFAWCADNDIPIFSHCNTGEFRAYYTEEYAENANPAYWEPVLKKHPKLRLCFGHAGGVTDWYGKCAQPSGHVPGTEKWGECVRRLCRTYPNVYCEFGIHEDIAHPETAEFIYDTLLRELPERGDGKWKLADKVMYGSDYFMPVSVTPKQYLEGFQRIFSLRGMEIYKARFFSGNAMKYLKRKVANRF